MRPKIDRPVIVEGKYDKLRLLSIFDAVVLTTDGFGVFRSEEKKLLIRTLAAKRGVLVLTDPDGAGLVIRNFLRGILPSKQITHLYIPPIPGVEKRKRTPSREGLLGVEGMEHAVDQMIVLDYLIANEDRHQNNFGLLRSADTLEWLGAAPIFDSGSSLGYDKLTPQILSARAIECKPFKKTHEEQLKLVTSFDWIDFGKLNGIEQDIRDILDQAGEYMDENRKTAIISAFSSRLGQLMVLAQVQRQEDDVAQDVDLDRAQDYGFKMEL